MKSISIRQCRNTSTGKIFNYSLSRDGKLTKITQKEFDNLQSNQISADSFYTYVSGDKVYQGKTIVTA